MMLLLLAVLKAREIAFPAPRIPEQRLMAHTRSRLASFVFDNSLLLLAGTIAAVTWANLDVASYEHVAHSLRFWVNEVGMVFFFALAAKEVFEATLPGGVMASPRHALCRSAQRSVAWSRPL
jgi:hypothetical protein